VNHQIIFGPEWVEIRTRGRASLEGFRAFGEALAADPRWVPDMDVLIDHSELDVSTLSSSNVIELTARSSENHPIHGYRKCAFYAPGELQFGIGRMWQQYRDGGTRADTRIFRSREEAEAWLRDDE